jgi:parvulin-like peptidyl-prolyl isomerase
MLIKEKRLRLALSVFPTLLLVLVLMGCEKEPIVVVNGEKITEKELSWHLLERLNEHRASGIQVNPYDLRHSVLQQMISEKLLAQGARENNITVSDEEVMRWVKAEKGRVGEENFEKALKETSFSEAEHREIVKEKILSDKFTYFLVPDHAVTDDEIKKYYKSSPTPFLTSEMMLVSFIRFPTKESAMALLEKIEESSFDEVSESLAGDDKYSVSTGYGWTDPDTYSPGIARSLKQLKKGEHGGPFKGKQGYFFFSVKDIKGERVKSLEEAKGEIRAILINQKRSTAVIHWVASKRRESTIAID